MRPHVLEQGDTSRNMMPHVLKHGGLVLSASGAPVFGLCFHVVPEVMLQLFHETLPFRVAAFIFVGQI